MERQKKVRNDRTINDRIRFWNNVVMNINIDRYILCVPICKTFRFGNLFPASGAFVFARPRSLPVVVWRVEVLLRGFSILFIISEIVKVGISRDTSGRGNLS